VAPAVKYEIMLTESVLLARPYVSPRNKRPCPAGKQFETYTQMQAVELNQLEPTAMKRAVETCTDCACRKACRQWLRTGVFNYAGDPRCPNAALLHI
jgi:hypothetical protein